MRIESALYASREGIQAHGKALSVVGDNISNSNTTGYKSSRIEFADLLPEGEDGHSSVAGPIGGAGVTVAAVRQQHELGVIEYTGRSLDAAIGGDGFFILGDDANRRYSRAGNFAMDGEGYLVDQSGMKVQGFAEGTASLSDINLLNLNVSGTETANVQIYGNLNASDPGAELVPVNPARFEDIASEANFISSVRVFDSLGVGHNVTLAYYKSDATPNEWTVQAYMNGSDIAGGIQDVPIQLGQNVTLNFNPDGSIANADAAIINAAPAYGNGAAVGNIGIDLSNFSQFGSNTSISAVTQDGEGTGEVKDYEFRADGGLYALLDSGTSVLVANMALATFPNQDGLDRAGNGLFVESGDSGTVAVDIAGAGNRGVLTGASLERSNVDTTTQFVDLVLYQRGYQAASQTLSAANEILRDTIALIR